MARLSLSSVALRDGIVHGLPVTGRELGKYHILLHTVISILLIITYFLKAKIMCQ